MKVIKYVTCNITDLLHIVSISLYLIDPSFECGRIDPSGKQLKSCLLWNLVTQYNK